MPHKLPLLLVVLCLSTGLSLARAQQVPVSIGNTPQKEQLVRLAKLQIDSVHLTRYNALLKEEIEASLRLEPGVLTLYAVAEKKHPTRITILEIYASQAAYQAHIQTPHFLKYKNGTKAMVLSLELVETIPLVPAVKVKQKQ